MWGASLMVRRWSQLLVQAIDPVLADSPFQAGQTGEPSTDDGCDWMRPGTLVIWCGDYDVGGPRLIHSWPLPG
jgi:hypothetical protein